MAADATAGSKRDREVQRVILIEGLANVLMLAIKAVVGVSTGSLAVLSDAVHSMTDVANNIVSWAIVRHSAKPPDLDHPYGHRKFETLAVFGLATLLTVVAIELALHALKRDQPEIIHDDMALGLMLFVLVVNITVAAWQRRCARRLKSDLLHADASHTFSDVLTTGAVIVGWQLSAAGYVWLDTVAALAVAGLVLYLAYGLFQRVIPVLVDERALDSDEIAARVITIPKVMGVNRIRSRWIGAERAVDLVILVDANLTTGDSHAIANSVEDVIEAQFGVKDITVHVEPHGEGRTH
ncbi:MAG: cation diffusion facilitator family transporter [Gammaproteobacteria bacterium]|nr:cation diffusion facilitator family transporter [Gammaproteobacteria bacterium]